MVCKKCSLCSKRIKNHALVEKNRCNSCHNYFHFKCLGLKDGSSSKSWNCHFCLLNNLPFFNLDNSKLKLTLEGRSAEDSVGLLKLLPSFTVQSLLDKIPGSFTIETDEFITDSTSSKYYKIDEFVTAKIPKNSFTILHMNIASLQGHIDNLKNLTNSL